MVERNPRSDLPTVGWGHIGGSGAKGKGSVIQSRALSPSSFRIPCLIHPETVATPQSIIRPVAN